MPWRLRARASEGARESGGAGERETSKVEASERGVAIEQARKLENPIARDGVVSAMQRRETAVDLARLCSRRCVGRRERGESGWQVGERGGKWGKRESTTTVGTFVRTLSR